MITGLHRILKLIQALLWATWVTVLPENVELIDMSLTLPTKTGGLGGAGIQTLDGLFGGLVSLETVGQ